MNRETVLLIEDENSIGNFMTAVLEHNDYNVIRAVSGNEGISLASSYQPKVVLLDLGLPDMDGLEVLKLLRNFDYMSIIVVSARGEETEKVKALDLGADDYITKPFGTNELMARIRLALRHNAPKNNKEETIFKVKDLIIDYDKRLVTIRGNLVHLTPIEYKILIMLAKNHNKVLTHSFIMKEIWGPFTNENQNLRVNMANLRRKIEINPADPEYIFTEVGVGYRLSE